MTDKKTDKRNQSGKPRAHSEIGKEIRSVPTNPEPGKEDALKQVHVVVENGWLRAEGTVASPSLHDDIVRGLRQVRGARGFIDRISVKPSV
jgi:osmotically-inducible protein OsmY